MSNVMRIAFVATLFVAVINETSARSFRAQRHQPDASNRMEHSLIDTDASVRVKRQYPYYHTTAELSTRLKELASTCKGAKVELRTVQEGDVSIDVAHVVKDPPPQKAPINKVFFLSGEHARELIGPETNLRFLEKICAGNTESSGVSLAAGFEAETKAADVLKDAEFTLVLNANPLSRVKVEEGDYCLRSNPNGVDLNRNWDEAWSEPMSLQTEPGQKPFSEPETRLLKKVAEDFKPTTFLSIHSGTLGMYMPWAWSVDKLASRNQVNMMRILEAVDKQHCRCPFGAAGKEVGYSCPGTSVDWVYDKGAAKYSFAFEVWSEEGSMHELRQRWQEKLRNGGASLLQQGHHLDHPHFHKVFANTTSDFVGLLQTSTHLSEKSNKEACFASFNPPTEKHYNVTVDNWASAYMQMVSLITSDLQQQAAA